MSVISTTIRDINESFYRKFRATCVENKMKTGDAINEAIRHWLKNREN